MRAGFSTGRSGQERPSAYREQPKDETQNQTNRSDPLRNVSPSSVGHRRGRAHDAATRHRLADRVAGRRVHELFYDEKGTMVLACSGHLRFAAATSDAIRDLMRRFEKSPGFFDGDQFFFNDPYVAGSHTYDMMIVKPIFYDGELIAWTATSTHTADTGGLLRGAAQEIFHEGICVPGLKIVEKDEFREDVFQTLTGMCRDPQYVGLDLKAMIAGNNICAKRYLGLVEKFGLKFVQLAGEKMIEDSEAKSRAKLRSMPDGTWVTRQYVTTLGSKNAENP